MLRSFQTLNVEQIINNLPGLFWIKDVDLNYVACNMKMRKVFLSKVTLIGQDDYNLPWAEYADMYRSEDEKVLTGQSFAFLHPVKRHNGEKLLIVSRKSPFYNSENMLMGVAGNITIVSSPDSLKHISSLQKTDFEIFALNQFKIGQYNILKDFPNLPLTQRECACLFYLIRGKTAQEIADTLFISKRTAEKRVANIKDKLRCKTKSELIDKAIESGFVNFIPPTILINNIK